MVIYGYLLWKILYFFKYYWLCELKWNTIFHLEQILGIDVQI